MSGKSIGRVAYLIPNQKFHFETTVIKVDDSLKQMYVGTSTGETLIYQLSTDSNKIIIKPKNILIPDPVQKSGRVKDLSLVNTVCRMMTVFLLQY